MDEPSPPMRPCMGTKRGLSAAPMDPLELTAMAAAAGVLLVPRADMQLIKPVNRHDVEAGGEQLRGGGIQEVHRLHGTGEMRMGDSGEAGGGAMRGVGGGDQGAVLLLRGIFGISTPLTMRWASFWQRACGVRKSFSRSLRPPTGGRCCGPLRCRRRRCGGSGGRGDGSGRAALCGPAAQTTAGTVATLIANVGAAGYTSLPAADTSPVAVPAADSGLDLRGLRPAVVLEPVDEGENCAPASASHPDELYRSEGAPLAVRVSCALPSFFSDTLEQAVIAAVEAPPPAERPLPAETDRAVVPPSPAGRAGVLTRTCCCKDGGRAGSL